MKLKSNITFHSGLFLFIVIAVFLSLTGDSFAQGRRLKDIIIISGNPLDSTFTSVQDSLDKAIQDSIRKLPVDSTARIKYFKYVPEYDYGTKTPEKISPLLLGKSDAIKYEVSFDSLNNVIVRQTFMGEDIKAPLVMTIDEYLKAISKFKQSQIFEDIVAQKFQGNTQDDLSKLFEKITNITIPLPFKSETIFGPPTINLSINGIIDITASYQKITSSIISSTTADNTQNNINFKQDVQVTARGRVGDKLSIDADWNTTRTFDFENQLKLKYEGYADEVIQKIEAGNVSLDTRMSLIPSSQALFGIRGQFKLGPLSLTTVVSQKKSKQETKDFSGGASQQNFTINVWNYSDNNYFLDTSYKSNFLDFVKDGFLDNPDNVARSVSLSNLEVYVQTTNTTSDRVVASLLVNLPPMPAGGYDTSYLSPQQIPGKRYFGFFRKLAQTEYVINYSAGYISLKTNLNDGDYVGITYQTTGNQVTPVETYGMNSLQYPNQTLALKMIKAGNVVPQQDTLAWALKMKNVYRLPVSRIVEDGFELNVNYIDPAQQTPSPTLPNTIPAGRQLLEILGLDRYIGKGPQEGQDKLFDFLEGRTINKETGDIIFPTLEPFNTDILAATGGDTTLVFREIYTKLKSEAQLSTNNSKYTITGKARGEAGVSSVISLGFNVVEGSVRVLLGAQELVLNQDYVVDYTTGTVTIKNAAALASKDLKVSYEQNELFQLASKTFIGARADYKVSDKTSFGLTFVNLKQETLNDKVRIGEEPTNNSMFGVDFQTEIKSKLLTRFINNLPGFNSKEESSFNFKGEFALISGDPNTKKSQIPSDNNEAVAYIDDMEGSKKIISVGTNQSSWTVASLPLTFKQGVSDTTRQSYRGRMRWFNVPNDVSVKDIFPLRDVQAGQDRLTPFYITYNPKERGQFNYNASYGNTNPAFGDTIADKSQTFNGIMKYLNNTSTDLVSENINFLEFNMKVDSREILLNNTNAKLNIELGLISEDAIPDVVVNPLRFHSEDRNNNGVLEENEDIGLDTLTNQQELDMIAARYGEANRFILGDDPSLDNNGDGTIINYNIINGTEGNRRYEGGNKPDTEDLNKNGTVDRVDAYRIYSIPLDTTSNNRIVGRGNNGWAQYRVPLSEFTAQTPGATLNNVQYIRIWVTGLTDTLKLSMVDLNLVGNQWVKPNRNDTSYSVSVVSIEENPQIYMSPVGGDILRQTIRNQNNVNTKSNEQSLSIDVRNLTQSGERKYARKDYGNAPLDLFNYKKMKLFVNGDPNFNYTNENIYDAAMVVRFGTDSNNYYEYRAPIHPDVRPGQPWNSQNEVTIDFTDLASNKIALDTLGGGTQAFKVVNGPPGAYYIIKGNPALNIIREIVLAVEKNRTGLNTSISGSTWFNEIRLLKVNDDNGYAFNLSANLKMSDLMAVNMTFSKTDPNFHAIDQRVGSRITGQAWDLSATVQAHKLVNNALVSIFGSEKWSNFLTMPISFRHAENIYKPKYFPGTDVEVQTAANQKYNQVLRQTGDETLAQEQSDNVILESQSLQILNSLNITGMSFNIPVDNYLFTNILNRFQFNFNAAMDDSRTDVYSSRNNINLSGGIAFNTNFGLSDKLNLDIGKFLNLGDKYANAKLYFVFPFIGLTPLFSNNFIAGTDFNRTKNESQQRRLLNADPVTRVFGANRNFGFDWKFIENWVVDLTGSYKFTAGSDLVGFETDTARNQLSQGQILNSIFFNNGFINFGKDLTYRQDVLIHPKIDLPVIDKFMTLNLDYNVAYVWTNPNQSIDLGNTVGYQNTITSTANFNLGEVFKLFKGGDGTTQQMGFNKGKDKYQHSQYLRSRKDSVAAKTDPAELLKIFTTFFPDNISVSLSQTNSAGSTNVAGRPGFANFWLYPTEQREMGPSRMYQLGFSRDPGNRVGLVSNVNDKVGFNNDITFTSVITPIIPDQIRMNLSFKTGWGGNNLSFATTDINGLLSAPTSVQNTKTKNYSTFFSGDVEAFSLSDTATGTRFANEVKSGLAGFPFPNWNLSISGLEKFPLFSEFAQAVTLDNSFTSDYAEGSSLDINNNEIVTTQRIVQSFSPLIGLNFSFKQLLGGNMTANLKFNSSKTYSINPQQSLIQVTNTSDWSLNANFTKAGFDIPLFGLELKNDIAFALSVARTKNDPIDYVYPRGIREKRPGGGSSQLTINPSIQYNLSSKVAMQLFYKYIKTEPTENTVTITPSTSNEGGLNIKITIQ